MRVMGIIPARMASSRFPGKPLAEICGIPMIAHVYYRSKMSKALDQVYVATCDKQIAGYIESIGGRAIMTADTHQRASDRTAEAMFTIESEMKKKLNIVVMIQGDEPMLYPEMINEAVNSMLKDENVQVVNLMAPLKSREEHADPNEVKVVVDKLGYAIYFSREPIPSWKKADSEVSMLKQICIIPFRRDFLVKFNQLKSTPLEIIESIDMLRVIEHGFKVKMVMTDHNTYSVDTEEDLKKVANLMKDDVLIDKYAIVKQTEV